MRDDDLRRAFDALRAHDHDTAPSFARMRSVAQRRARARRARLGLAIGAGLAAAVILAIGIGSGAPEPELGLRRPAEPLAFLLEPPSASVISADDPIEQIGEAW